MRRRNDKSVLVFILFILVVLVLAWWIAGDYYKPYPPATPTATPGYWPTRVTATIVPSATPTRVIVTPIQPTIEYTATPYEPPVTVTSTPVPVYTDTPTITPLPILYNSDKDKETLCTTYFIRPWGIKRIDRCWQPAWWRLPFIPPSIWIP